MKPIIQISVLVIVLSSCFKISYNGDYEYRINGKSTTSYVGSDYQPPMSKTTSGSITYITIDKKTLMNQKLPKTQFWNDTTITIHKSQLGTETYTRTMLQTSIKKDTFYHIKKEKGINSYLFEASTNTTGIRIENKNDSTKFRVTGSFTDTIFVSHKSKRFSNKVALNAINSKILKKIKDQIRNESKKRDHNK